MYEHYLRDIGGRSNLGWLRNCYYSILQTIMRKDPVYYLLYCSLREDGAWKFISYPYYMKYATSAPSTFFRHIDLNVNDADTHGIGKNMLQGTVSFLDEDETNATEILPGMHNRFHEWNLRLQARGHKSTAKIETIDDRLWNESDKEYFGVNWEAVLYKAGYTRITLPLIPYRA
jgi:hypothetical protein